MPACFAFAPPVPCHAGRRTSASVWRSCLAGPLAVAALALGLVLSVLATPAARAQGAGADGLKAALAALDGSDTGAALALAGRLHDPVARRLVHWTILKRGLGTFGSISAFMDANPDWPHQAQLQRAAERALTGREDPRRLAAWFERHPPLTTDGLVARAKALSAVGPQPAAVTAIREAWREGRFSDAEQTSFYSQFRRFLEAGDHQARLSGLLWDERITEAQRMLPLVDAGHRALAEARARLIRDESGVDAAVARVPASLRTDPGLMYDRLVWRRRHGLEDRATDLLLHPSANKGRPDLWASQRHYLGREALQDGRMDRAYAVFANHGHTSGLPFAVGEWTAGWIALRFRNDARRALTHFETMYAGVSYPQSLSRAAYWAGRAAEALGQRDTALAWYDRAAGHPETFYGQLAIEALGSTVRDRLPAPPPVTEADETRFRADTRVRAVELLIQAGRPDLARPFLRVLAEPPATPGLRARVGAFLLQRGRIDLAVAFARRAALEGTFLMEAGYPVPADVLQGVSAPPPSGPRPDPALLLSLIRQESNFDTDAVSRAGARGLMQLMPKTAQREAMRLGITSSTLRLTSDPAHNTRLGTVHYAGLLDQFAGADVLAIAAYNAGSSRADRWMRENGDPRRMNRDGVVDWIERITFSETRNYVQRVLEGAQIYRLRLGHPPSPRALGDRLTPGRR